jgi:hypothetical protein
MMRKRGKTATATPVPWRFGLDAGDRSAPDPWTSLWVGSPDQARAYGLAGDDLDALAIYGHWQNFPASLDDSRFHPATGIRLD